ncbi:hypothetical protein B4U79_06116 [Dinothrombium tinctorium]|uniref:Uncharacterized protein n=1 Tax=Dinothrombium tinctorium TaxID=1965070 RepID=A0A443RHK0_9ACAR|nr:hypothetical protein B4U79_06116 [Dinothrombium tinctorium]
MKVQTDVIFKMNLLYKLVVAQKSSTHRPRKQNTLCP